MLEGVFEGLARGVGIADRGQHMDRAIDEQQRDGMRFERTAAVAAKAEDDEGGGGGRGGDNASWAT